MRDFIIRRNVFLRELEIQTSFSIKNPQFWSDFDLQCYFGISICKFHNKILIWPRLDDLKFWPLLAMRSKLWRPVARGRAASETSNLVYDLSGTIPVHDLFSSLQHQSILNRAHTNQHIKIHSREKSFKCTLCRKQYFTKENLIVHTRWHTNEKPFKCHICEKYFSQKGNLKTHLKSHTQDKDFKCIICGKCYTRKETLKDHVAAIHYKIANELYCDICGKTFCWKSNFKKHLKIHSEEKT